MMRRLFTTPKNLTAARLFATAVKAPEPSSQAATVTFTVDGKTVKSPVGTYLIDAMRQAGIDVPTMCYHSDTKNSGGICRICLVEDVTRPGAMPIISCRTPVAEGMQISTKSQRLFQLRHANTTLMFRTHPTTCLTCSSNTKCETQNQACKMNIHSGDGKALMYQPSYNPTIDNSTVINRKMELCIGCDRCIQACSTQCNVYEWYNKDYHAVETFGPMRNSECIQCGQCINRCPTGALTERPEIDQVMAALADKDKHVVFQIAPAIRVAIGEEFGLKPGERVVKNEMVTALKALGKNVTVLDTDFGADLTIMEEASEFLERLCRNAGKKYLSPEAEYNSTIPMFTSCCPGWVTFMEKNFPDMLPHLSSCKSPMQMQSAMIKTYWAEKIKGIKPKNVVNVAIMPCTAKKEEKDRADMRTAEFKWTDYILTTREAARIFKQAGLDLATLPQTPFDKTMGISSGAGAIFGVTGGVLEAALRTGYEAITGRAVPFKNLEIVPLRSMEGVREARIKFEHVKPEFSFLEGFECRVAVAHQIINAKKVVEMVKEAKAKGQEPPWHLIEVMACPGGCLGGGGQPKPTSLPIRQARASLIYKEDRDLPIRKSHDNPEIIEMYQNYLTHPLSERAHHLLHRSYTPFAARYSATFSADEAKGIEEILDKYQKGKQEYLLPMAIDETDRKGYLSGAAIVKIAQHIGVNPGRVASIVSNYQYIPRTHTADTHVYMCMCHNCVMHGQDRNYKRMKELQEQGAKFTVHKMNWLGLCVNDAPASMVKRTGTDYVEYMMGLNESNLEERVAHLNDNIVKTPQNRIKLFPFTRLGPSYSHCSMLEPMPDELIDASVETALRVPADEILKKLQDAKLEGRGGAGFPTFRKWDSVRKAIAPKKYVICNADEGLPSTYKDWWILNDDNARKRLIAGMGVCARVIGAKKAYIYLRYEYRNLVPDLKKTVETMKGKHPEFADIDFEVRLGGGPYVAGEETAQFQSIQGEAPVPRKNRPWNVFPTMQGLFGQPTVINNVETFFSVPYIVHHNAKDIASYGLPKILGVTGDVDYPALFEYALHSNNKPTVNKLIKELNAVNIMAAEVGGSTEPLMMKKDFDKNIGFGMGVLNAVGSMVLFNSTRSLKEAYLRKVEFMAEESCRQCVPCREGSKVLRNAVHDVVLHGNKGKKATDEMLRRVAEATVSTSICAHGRALGPLFDAAYSYVSTH